MDEPRLSMDVRPDRMLKWFEFDHLKEPLRDISECFHNLAHLMCQQLKPGPERTVMLRKMLEAKDAAVRQKIEDGYTEAEK